MKNLLVVAFLMFCAISPAQEEASQLNWLVNLEEAQETSKQQNKPILVYFTGSDWCPPCKALKKDFFETEDFATRAQDLVLVMVDYPRRTDIITPEQKAYNKGIIDKYNKDRSFPKIIMLNANGRELGELSGYSSYSTYQDTSHHYAFVDKYVN